MKSVAKWFVVLGLVVSSGTLCAQVDPNFHIYLMIGQSNMEGQGQAASEDWQVPAGLQVMHADDSCTNNGASYGQWREASTPLIRCYTGLGPGEYFGRTVLQGSGDGVRIGLVGAAFAGQPINFFRKDCASLGSCQPTIDGLVAPLDQGGYVWILDLARRAQQDGVIKGIIFHQGESNTGETSWPGYVNEMVTDLRNDLGLRADDVPFIAAEMVPEVCCTLHNAQVHRIPEVVANGHYVSTDGLGAVDQYHFDTEGYRELGRRYGLRMLALVNTDAISNVEVRDTDNSDPVIDATSPDEDLPDSESPADATDDTVSPFTPVTDTDSDESAVNTPTQSSPELVSGTGEFNILWLCILFVFKVMSRVSTHNWRMV